MKIFKNIEKRISTQFQKEFTIFTKDCTTAIWLALKTLEIKNKLIIVPTNVCFVVPCAIVVSGNIPMFVDIDESLTIDSKLLLNIFDKDVKAVVLPHMYGQLANIQSILNISKSKGWIVIEDVAQALGSRNKYGEAGSFADISVTSWYWEKYRCRYWWLYFF